MIKPSDGHANRQAFNSLAYDASDQYLSADRHCFRGRVFDLGCGDSSYKNWILQSAERYIGVDWSSHNTGSTRDVSADLNQALPFADQVADTVVSLSVLEHLREPQQFLSEAWRILKPGGYLVMQVPFMWWVHEAPHDYFRYTRHGLQYMLEKAGFTEIVIHETTGFWVMWTLKLNYQLARCLRGPAIVQKPLAMLLRILWVINQWLAKRLDVYWPCPNETAGYHVRAIRR